MVRGMLKGEVATQFNSVIHPLRRKVLLQVSQTVLPAGGLIRLKKLLISYP